MKIYRLLAALVLCAGLAGAAQGQGARARAVMKDGSGKDLGTVSFEQNGPLVKVRIELRGLPPGEHSLHIHEKAACTAPGFESAGEHFNPTGAQHGFLNPAGPHAGDLPNIAAGKDGMVVTETATGRVTLEKGKPNSLFKPGGTSVVIHENPDDYHTDPSGGGGRRIACGVVEEVK